MNNRSLLVIVIFLLIGIGGMMLVQMNEKTPAEKISDSVSETMEGIVDEIDDNTTGS